MTTMLAATTTEHLIDSADGLKLLVRSWHPPTTTRGVVAIVHGVNCHSGYYTWVAEQFAAKGLATYAVDLRGRGASDGARFYLDELDDYLHDVDALVTHAQSREGGLPLFLLGHSAGGAIASVYTLEHQVQLAGFISDSFAPQAAEPDFALAGVRGVTAMASHAELIRAGEILGLEFPSIRLPLLILHGTADKITNLDGSRLFYKTAGSEDKTLRLYQGHSQDLLDDLDRDVVMADITAWIEGRLPRSPAKRGVARGGRTSS